MTSQALVLEDFGGRFLTTGRCKVNGMTYPDVCAYVQYFVPRNAHDVSITFVHGGGGQGAEFLTTADGRPGWAHAFLREGYPVYILDRPGHGRSTWSEPILGPATGPPDYDSLYSRFVDVKVGNLWPEARFHSRWSADAVAGDRFMASQGPLATSLCASQRHVEAIAPELFAMTGPTVLISHSAGGPCGWALAAIGGDDVAAIIAVEPLGYPGQEHALGSFDNGLVAAPFTGNANPYGRPLALITGEAGWMREANSKAAKFLQSEGYPVEHIRLWEHGIHGNGHMMMSETNSDEIAALMVEWLACVPLN